MSIYWTLLKSLPEIIALLKAIQKGIDEAETNRKVGDDVKTIHEAFNEKDPEKLKALFNSK